MTQFGQVKNWLGGRHIKVPDDWLEACLEWLMEENQGAPLSDSQLRGMVYEQWLAADLHELQTSCLPTDLPQQAKFFLQGVYCIQVDSLLDVSQPYYGQLQKVCGTENANVNVTATQATQPAWEMKSGRMLMLKITDGTTDLQGMEYKPIPSLKTSLLPGCKVRLKGRILCRQGVLFLKAENVEILGGEVDALLESNTQDKLLKNALSSTDNNTGGDLRREFTGSIPVGKNQGKQSVDQGQTILSSRQQITAQKTASNMSGNKRNVSDAHSQNTVDEMEDDDFLESLATSELEALEQEWDVEMEDNSQAPSSAGLNRGSSSTRSHVSQLPVCQRKQSAPAAMIGQSKPAERSQPMRAQISSSLSRPSQLGRPAQLGKPTSQIHSAQSRVNPGQRPEVIGGQRSKSQVDKIAEIEMEMEDLADLMNDDFPMDDDNDFEDPCFLQTTAKKSKSTTKPSVATSSNCTNSSTSTRSSKRSSDQCSTSYRSSSFSSVTMTSARSSTDQRLSNTTEHWTSSSTTVIRQRSDNTVSVSKSSSTTAPSDFSAFSNPDDFINHLKSLNRNVQRGSGASDAEPFTYISKVMSRIQLKRKLTFKVKAYVATLLGKLDSGQGQGWTLTCRLNDGTATLDVDLTDQVLTELIGFSAKDSIAIKNGLKGDKSVLSEGIKDCQLKLINVSCIFTVASDPTYIRPRVTAISPITRAHIEQLYARVCNSGAINR